MDATIERIETEIGPFDQWAPNNGDGKKVYEKDFLLLLRNHPASWIIPKNIPNGARLSVRTDVTNPPFQGYGGKSSSKRCALPKRNGQTGKVGHSGSKGNKSQVSEVSTSAGDVKLHEAENAWKPARFLKSDNMSDQETKTEELYKKVRAILNKLTPQKFETLVRQVRELQLDTADRLQGVIDLVFEKAIYEPPISVIYALMCRELAHIQVPAADSTEDKQEVVNFRKLLVTRCQIQFEEQFFDESVRMIRVKKINECRVSEKKRELQFELEDYDRRLRLKSIGNIRFIGELFKQQILTVKIMMWCLCNLLDRKDQGSLECLCTLLTIIGKELESKKIDLAPIFNAVKIIVDKEHGKVTSRVRFMLQDVIDLSKNKWIPRCHVVPTLEETENSVGKRNSTPSAVQSYPLGIKPLLGNCNVNSHIKTDMTNPTNTANMYTAIEQIDTEMEPSAQWAPKNFNGKKVYDKDFLIALRNHPASWIIPDNIPAGALKQECISPLFGNSSSHIKIDMTTATNLDNVLDAERSATGLSKVTYGQIYNKLTEFVNSKTSFDDIINWITNNVGERLKENRFIRTLATTIFENSISHQKFISTKLQDHYKLLQNFVNNNPKNELQCLFGLQGLMYKQEHPKGVLLQICNQLYKDSIISQDSFLAWKIERENKGVALTELTNFFTQLKKNNSEYMS